MCYFEIELLHIIACIAERWWNSFCLEETGYRFIVRYDKCWFWCYREDVRKLEKNQINRQKFLPVNRPFWLCGGEDFWSERDEYVCFFDWVFWSGMFSINSVNPAPLKLSSVLETSCFRGKGCFRASSQSSLRALFSESRVPFSSQVMLILTSAFKSL